jgi:hypothetical protein
MPGTSWSPRPVLKVLSGLLHQSRLEAHLGGASRTGKVCSCGAGELSAGLMLEDAQEVSLEQMDSLEASYACVTAPRPLPAACCLLLAYLDQDSRCSPPRLLGIHRTDKDRVLGRWHKASLAEKGRAQRCDFQKMGRHVSTGATTTQNFLLRAKEMSLTARGPCRPLHLAQPK